MPDANPYMDMFNSGIAGDGLTAYLGRVSNQQNAANLTYVNDTENRVQHLEYTNSQLQRVLVDISNKIEAYEEISKAQADLILNIKQRIDAIESSIITLTD